MRISDWSSDVCSSDLYADLLDRRLVHHRRDLARHALIDAHVLAGGGIDEADALGRSKLIDRPGAEVAQENSRDRFAARQGSDVEIFASRQGMRMRDAAAVATDLVMVAKRHDLAAQGPKPELEHETKPDTLVDEAEQT